MQEYAKHKLLFDGLSTFLGVSARKKIIKLLCLEIDQKSRRKSKSL